jgi:hypothetical protein
MSARTYEAGEWVGNGPSVSVGATVQLVLLEPPVVVVVVPVAVLGVTSSLPQAASRAGADTAPANRLLRKNLRSIKAGGKGCWMVVPQKS